MIHQVQIVQLIATKTSACCCAQVVISLEEPQEGTTVLRLKQTGVPKEDRFGNGDVVESTAQGWKAQIFHRIRAVFGFGLGM